MQVHRVTPTPMSQAKGTNWTQAGAAAPDTCHAAAIFRHGSSIHVGVLSSGLGAVALIH